MTTCKYSKRKFSVLVSWVLHLLEKVWGKFRIQMNSRIKWKFSQTSSEYFFFEYWPAQRYWEEEYNMLECEIPLENSRSQLYPELVHEISIPTRSDGSLHDSCIFYPTFQFIFQSLCVGIKEEGCKWKVAIVGSHWRFWDSRSAYDVCCARNRKTWTSPFQKWHLPGIQNTNLFSSHAYSME